MLYLIAACVAFSIALLIIFVGQLNPGQPPAVARRLSELEHGVTNPLGIGQRRRRQIRALRLKSIMEAFGSRVESSRSDSETVRRFLVSAGFVSQNAVAFYWAIRIILGVGLPIAALLTLPLLGATFPQAVLGAGWFGILGYIGPIFYVGHFRRARQKELQHALPDALDLMVVCVEAGLALNQAMVRVSEEIDTVSPLMSEQLALVNLEIRAGTPREEALRHFADRTDLPDVASLVAMLIQTDRFGTSIAQALRIHADTLRTKRRQRAEEAGAKTSIKLLFPLVFFIFPAMFVVILGPAIIQIYRTMSKL